MFGNERIKITLTHLRQNIVKSRRLKNNNSWYWKGMLEFNITHELGFRVYKNSNIFLLCNIKD
jgi:hypothetical protein